jgi:hypothetical protein
MGPIQRGEPAPVSSPGIVCAAPARSASRAIRRTSTSSAGPAGTCGRRQCPPARWGRRTSSSARTTRRRARAAPRIAGTQSWGIPATLPAATSTSPRPSTVRPPDRSLCSRTTARRAFTTTRQDRLGRSGRRATLSASTTPARGSSPSIGPTVGNLSFARLPRATSICGTTTSTRRSSGWSTWAA